MNKKILVIDDDESVRDAFALALDDDQFAVETASNGPDGLEIGGSFQPDIVFLDLNMPNMTGIEVLRALRAQHGNGILIYVVTAFYKDFLEPLTEMAEQGIPFELVQKPIYGEQIREIVNAMAA